jgi:hypothetical protein
MESGDIHFTPINKSSDSNLYSENNNDTLSENAKMINSIITVGIILSIAIYLKMTQPKY